MLSLNMVLSIIDLLSIWLKEEDEISDSTKALILDFKKGTAN